MASRSARQPNLTRRMFLAVLSLSPMEAAGARGSLFPSAIRRYLDAVTEFEVIRLTDPAYASYLPACHAYSIARRGSFLVHSSDRTGSLQAYRLDVKGGQSRLLTEAPELDPSSLNLVAGDAELSYWDGRALRQVHLSQLRDREVYRVPVGWARGEGHSLSTDRLSAVFVESRAGGGSRINVLDLRTRTARVTVESPEELRDPLLQPGGQAICFRTPDDSLRLLLPGKKEGRALPLATGSIGPARWAPDGKSIFYLSHQTGAEGGAFLRTYALDTGKDELIAKTSQFAAFGANADASVFVGASASAAGPYVLILLRVAHREMALCQHGASQAKRVTTIFSPDSQSVYFQSDRHGKPAIYRLNVERLVERTTS